MISGTVRKDSKMFLQAVVGTIKETYSHQQKLRGNRMAKKKRRLTGPFASAGSGPSFLQME